MSKHPFNQGFDPYDTLLEAVERIQRLEQAHNNLVVAYEKTEQEFNIALKSVKHLQQGQIHILNRLRQLEEMVKDK